MVIVSGRVLAAGGSSRWSSALANDAEALEEVHCILKHLQRAVPG